MSEKTRSMKSAGKEASRARQQKVSSPVLAAGRPVASHVPAATYRLQFNRQFTFAQAAAMADYLRELGISDCYASPLFQAGPQSTHGYDICGFDQFNPNLGNATAFEDWSAHLQKLGLGLLLDMVPNHMGNDLSNTWWLDVLEKGQASPYGSWFDIDWQPLKADLHNQVLLPVLEDHYARVLEAGKLRLVFERGGFAIAYYERQFPLAPHTYPRLLKQVLTRCGPEPQTTVVLRNLEALIEALSPWEASGESARQEFAKVKEQLQQWHQQAPDFRRHLEATLAEFNGQAGAPRSFNRLHGLLQQQHYRLAYWRVGPEEINYRRFFDITDLVSLRMELPQVFAATHQLVFRLLQEGKVTGLRIDHPDGLWDPKQYCQRLQAGFRSRLADSGQSQGIGPTPLYVVVEKILTGDEPLPPDWPVAGTTGYDFLNRLNGLFVNGANAGAFDQLYQEFTGTPPEFEALVDRSKKLILQTSLISELRTLTHRLKGLAVSTRYGQDFTFNQLHAALFEIIAAFPVYRTYVTAESREVSPTERAYILQAMRTAKERNGALDEAVLAFIQNLLLLQPPADLDAAGQARCRDFVLRFQQLTGPVMAKGLEDTAFYNFNRFVSLNEVGGDPGQFGVSLEDFHAYNTAQAEHWSHALLATATHDTKRGEDLRARLNVLSELPAPWCQAVLRWRDWNAEKKGLVDGQPAPHPNDEYLLYQTLVGAWLPEAADGEGLRNFRERIGAYLLKALKEAKARTTWTRPNAAYEAATQRFVEALLSPDRPNPFLEDLIRFQHQVAFFGALNSLSQTLLKLTAPGVPDFYQGTELWDFNLVDPDNRRPVDYDLRRQLLSDLKDRLHHHPTDRNQVLRDLLEHSHTGQVKLFLIWCALTFRHLHRDLFEQGAYIPLLATGPQKEHLCAFAREWQGQSTVVVVPRLIIGLMQGAERLPLGKEVWQDTAVPLPNVSPNQQYRNVLTEEIVSAADSPGGSAVFAGDVLTTFPVALLERL